MTSGPLVALVLEGDEAIDVVRAINGATDGRKAAPGTIRGDLSLSNRENLVHGSDSAESAEREIAIWFPACLSRPPVSTAGEPAGFRPAAGAGSRHGARPPTDPIDDPFFAAVRRRHPDVDLVVLPPEEPATRSPAQVPPDEVAAARLRVVAEAARWWAVVEPGGRGAARGAPGLRRPPIQRPRGGEVVRDRARTASTRWSGCGSSSSEPAGSCAGARASGSSG